MTQKKRIREFYYCCVREREQDFSGYIWPTIRRNYEFLAPINTPAIFQQHPHLYELKYDGSCSRLRRNDYLIKVASAVTFFGQRFIIPDLNEYCRNYVDDAATTGSQIYQVPEFRHWSDVTNYVGGRYNQKDPTWLREKKQLVFDQIPQIAQRNRITVDQWRALVELYGQRNEACHPSMNTADAASIKQFADENLEDGIEKGSVQALHEVIKFYVSTSEEVASLVEFSIPHIFIQL